jgi:antitoxin component HigA of HigAB toxin-antitoxin module
MDIEPIKTQRDYRRVLKEIEGLMMAKHNTAEGDRLDVLVTLVEAWERKHYPLDLPDPVEAIKYHMERNGLQPRDLIPFIGSAIRCTRYTEPPVQTPNHFERQRAPAVEYRKSRSSSSNSIAQPDGDVPSSEEPIRLSNVSCCEINAVQQVRIATGGQGTWNSNWPTAFKLACSMFQAGDLGICAGAVAYWNAGCIGMGCPIFVRIVEHAATVVVDEAFRESALGDDHVVGFELDVHVLDLVGALRLHDRDAIEKVLGLDQHATAFRVSQIHRVVRRDP